MSLFFIPQENPSYSFTDCRIDTELGSIISRLGHEKKEIKEVTSIFVGLVECTDNDEYKGYNKIV